MIQENEVKEAVALILTVMRGELDGKSCTIPERLRAAAMVYRLWAADGLAGIPISDDPLSQALDEIEKRKDECEDVL